MEDTGGAEEAEGEHIGLLFGFVFTDKFLGAYVFGIFEIVAEENVTQLVGDSETALGDGSGVIVYDAPAYSVVVGFSVFTGEQIRDNAVTDDVDIGGTCNL